VQLTPDQCNSFTGISLIVIHRHDGHTPAWPNEIVSDDTARSHRFLMRAIRSRSMDPFYSSRMSVLTRGVQPQPPVGLGYQTFNQRLCINSMQKTALFSLFQIAISGRGQSRAHASATGNIICNGVRRFMPNSSVCGVVSRHFPGFLAMGAVRPIDNFLFAPQSIRQNASTIPPLCSAPERVPK